MIQPYSFHFGMVDPQSYFNPNAKQFGLANAENVRVGDTGELILRGELKDKITIPLSGEEEILEDSTVIFKDNIVFATTIKDDGQYLYFFPLDSTDITKLVKTKVSDNTTRPVKIHVMATGSMYKNNPLTVGGSFLLICSSNPSLQYILNVGDAAAVFITTHSGGETDSPALDLAVLQGRLWLLQDKTDKNGVRIWGSNIDKLDNFTENSSAVATTAFVFSVIPEAPEITYSITPSQTILMLATSQGIRIIRSRNPREEGITSTNVEQALTSSLASTNVDPVMFYSRFFIYDTPAGLYYKEVNHFEEKLQGVQDEPVFKEKHCLEKITKLMGSKRTSSFYVAVGGNLLSSGFIQSSSVPYTFNLTNYIPKRANRQVHHYFPDDKVLVDFDKSINSIILSEEDEYPKNTAPYLLGFYFLKKLTEISLHVKISGTEEHSEDLVQVRLVASDTRLAVKVVQKEIDTILEFVGTVVGSGEVNKSLCTEILEISVSPNYNRHVSILDVILT